MKSKAIRIQLSVCDRIFEHTDCQSFLIILRQLHHWSTDIFHYLFFKSSKNNQIIYNTQTRIRLKSFSSVCQAVFSKATFLVLTYNIFSTEGSMTSRSTKTKSVMGDRTNTHKRIELTNKRLDLLLPSTRQLMLNSSIKYNTDEDTKEMTISKHQLEQPAPMPKKEGYGKQNDGGFFGAASKGVLQRQGSAFKLEKIGEGPVPQNSQDPNTLLQPLKSIKKPVASHINRPLSAAQLPNYQQANQKNLTSLNNILPHRLDQNKQKEDNTSKEDLLKRVDRLEKLVQDIIAGKVVIHRKSKSQSKMKVTKPQRTSIKVLEECSRKCKNRSVTWNAEVDQAGSSKSLKSNKSKSRLRIQSSQQRKMLNIIKIPLINPKGFLIKKKNPLKLAPNYQPIREQSQQKSEAKNLPKYISPIGQRSSQSNLFSKLKTKVLFTPNLINM